MSDAIKHITIDNFSFQEDSALVHMHCACNTDQVLRRSQLPFSWTMPPTAPSWMHWLGLQDLGNYTAAWVWVVSQKDWRNQAATSWILTMHWYSIWVKTRRPASADRTVRRQFHATGVQTSRERSYPLPIYWYHSKGNWLRYNSAAESFYIMKLCSRLFVFHCRNCPKDDKFW